MPLRDIKQARPLFLEEIVIMSKYIEFTPRRFHESHILSKSLKGSPSLTRTSDPMINSHATWVNRERLQQIRLI